MACEGSVVDLEPHRLVATLDKSLNLYFRVKLRLIGVRQRPPKLAELSFCGEPNGFQDGSDVWLEYPDPHPRTADGSHPIDAGADDPLDRVVIPMERMQCEFHRAGVRVRHVPDRDVGDRLATDFADDAAKSPGVRLDEIEVFVLTDRAVPVTFRSEIEQRIERRQILGWDDRPQLHGQEGYGMNAG